MPTKLSDRVQNIKPSKTLAVTAKAAELRAKGRPIIGLGAGEPDFDTPMHIKEAAKQAIDEGFTRYTPVAGIDELKQAIINKLARDNFLDYEMNEVMVSTGAKQAIYNLMQAYLNAGDEVIIPAPYWVSYPDMVKLAEGEPVCVLADITQGFKITPAQLESSITPKTRMLMLNSPSNPTGAVYTKEELQALGAVLEKYQEILIVSDDIYEHILFNDAEYFNIATANPSLKDRTVVINGVSKAYAMTGWRIGYAAGPANLIKSMTKIQGQSTSNPCSIAQKAAVAALDGPQECLTPMVKAFKERHDFVHQSLSKIDGIEAIEANGAFYSFFSAQKIIERLKEVNNDNDLAEYLINESELAFVPGSAFGAEGYLRMSYATDMGTLQTAMERLAKVLS